MTTRNCASLVLILGARLSIPFFFFNDTATTEIYTLSLHDALPISSVPLSVVNTTMVLASSPMSLSFFITNPTSSSSWAMRSEEHTSELQSQSNLVCRLLLEKKKSDRISDTSPIGELRDEDRHDPDT